MNCPACELKRRHTAEEWKAFHPLAGHGYGGYGVEWSSVEAKEAHDVEQEPSK